MPSVYSVVKKGSRNDSCFTLFFLSRSFAGMYIATNADGEVMTSEARSILQESGAELTSGNYKVRIGLVQ